MISAWRSTCLFVGLTLLSSAQAKAQSLERSFDLREGWNSVFLSVDPTPGEADLLFEGLPVSSVWARTPKALVDGPPDCPDPNDVSCAPPQKSGWRIWLPPDHKGRLATTLRLIRGGRVYLIHATAPATWTVVGIPNGSKTQWQRGHNLVGFHVVDDPSMSPTFDAYLSSSPAFLNTSLHEIAANGSKTLITDPVTQCITPGRGYWVSSDRETEFDGPVDIDKGSLRGIDFGKNLLEHAVVVENLTSSNLSVNVAYSSSAPVPPPPTLETLAGDVPMKWFDYNVGGLLDDSLEWKPFTTNSWSLDPTGQPGARATARFSVDRAGLAPATVDLDGVGSQYEGLLEVSDGNGFLRRLPVAAQVVPGSSGGTAAVAGGAPAGTPGLYYGTVTVDQVAWVSAGSRVWTNSDPNDPTFSDSLRCDGGDNPGASCEDDNACPNGACSPFCIGGSFDGDACLNTDKCTGGTCSADLDTTSLRPTPAQFVFPIIVHHSDTDEFKLLTEVIVLWEPGDDVAETTGRYVLATPDCLPAVCDVLEAGSVQDGQPFSRRISTAAFSFDDDLMLTGSFASTLSGQTTLPADHPLNPLRHKYHPDHDCDLGGECFDITRTFVFSFDSQPPDTLTRPGWGDSLLTGTFTEQLLGLHKHPIHVQGRFEIQRVSQVATLNAQ